ncbi:MT-A70 family methyltransferase [Aliidiomarina sp. Khilg15.8]
MKYRIIYADPPWKFRNKRTGGSMKSGADAQYPTMTLEQMKALDVESLCAKDCVLVMWYVSSQPQDALDLAKAWGFTLKTMNGFIWVKLTKRFLQFFGMGSWTRGGAECALIATRGRPKAASKSIRQVRLAVIGRHSEKPAEFRDDVVSLCGDEHRLEMFARAEAPGWDVFGNEAPASIQIPVKTGNADLNAAGATSAAGHSKVQC